MAPTRLFRSMLISSDIWHFPFGNTSFALSARPHYTSQTDRMLAGWPCKGSGGGTVFTDATVRLTLWKGFGSLVGELGIGKKAKDLSFDDARKKFEDWAKADKKPNTVRSYTICLDQLGQTFSGKRLSDITPWTLEAYKKRRGEGKQLTQRPSEVSDAEWRRRCKVAERGAPIRANRELAVLKTVFSKCRAWGLYEGENPVCKVKFRKEPRTRLRILEPAEEARLLDEAKEPLRSLILVGLHTGLRIQAEALQLRWDDVDLPRGLLTVQAAYAKNGRTRTVPLNSVVRGTLDQLQRTATTDVIFGVGSIGKAFRKACAAAKITGVTPHTLRHTFASRLVMSGADLRTVQELGGWQTIAMVERYSHLNPHTRPTRSSGLQNSLISSLRCAPTPKPPLIVHNCPPSTPLRVAEILGCGMLNTVEWNTRTWHDH